MGKTKKSETGGAEPAGEGTPKEAAPSADGLARAATAAARKGPPPVHLWNPPDCGALDMRIARDGTWFYQGTPIGRPAMVRLFSSILRLDPDGYVLVTPVEKVHITVDDAPFVAVDVEARDGALTFRTNVGEEVTAGPENAIRVERDPETGEPRPYVHVRRGLEALIDRKTFYRLVDFVDFSNSHEVSMGDEWFGVWSQNTFFPIVSMHEVRE